jgi:hypothetical protein
VCLGHRCAREREQAYGHECDESLHFEPPMSLG